MCEIYLSKSLDKLLMVKTKRIIVATILGIVCGIFCAYGTKEVLPEFTMLMLLGVVYNRMLIGLLIGFADEIKIHPAVQACLWRPHRSCDIEGCVNTHCD